MLKAVATCTAAVLLVLGCGGGGETWSHPNVGPGISRRYAEDIWGPASFEFDCPREQIRLQKVAYHQVGATGCGQRAVYVLDMSHGWIRNSEVSRSSTDR